MTATIDAADVCAGHSCCSSYWFRPRASLLVAPAADRRFCCDDPPVVLAALRRGVDPRTGQASGVRPIDVQSELPSGHGPQIITARRNREWESRDRAPAAVGHETAPGVAVSGVQAAMAGCWRRGGWILSRAVASDGSHRPGSSLSGCSSTTDRVDVNLTAFCVQKYSHAARIRIRQCRQWNRHAQIAPTAI